MRAITIITDDPPPSCRKDSIEMRFIDRSISTSDDDEQGIRDRIELLKKAGLGRPCPWCHGRYDSLDGLRYAVHVRSKYVEPTYCMICEACEPLIEDQCTDYVVPRMASMGNMILFISEWCTEGELRFDPDMHLDWELLR